MKTCRGCGVDKTNHSRRLCSDCNKLINYRYAARNVCAGEVFRAKRDGRLPPLDGSVECVDCGNDATQWEHRDYARPLDVEPVCGPCNTRRGPGRLVIEEIPVGFLDGSTWARNPKTDFPGRPNQEIHHQILSSPDLVGARGRSPTNLRGWDEVLS